MVFNGERPELASTKARREVKWAELWEKEWTEEAKLQQKLIDDGFTWDDEIHSNLGKRGLELASRTLIPPENIINERQLGVIFCHGYADSLRWYVLNQFLKHAENGALVTGLELEGHGLSDKTHGLMIKLDDCISDIHEFVKIQQKKYAQIKHWFLHGESMGGMCALLESVKAAEDPEVHLDGMILAAPMCKIADNVKPHPAVVKILLCLSKIMPSFAVVPSAIHDDIIFKREDIREKGKRDPLRYFGKPRLASAATLFYSTQWLNKNLDKITTPFLVLHGKKDIVTTAEASVELFEKTDKVKPEDKKIILADEGWHGLLLAEPEEDIKMYWEEVFNWINNRCNKAN